VGSFHLRPPVFFMSPDRSLPIIDLTYRLVLEVNRAVGEFPRSQRPGLGRRGEAAAFDLLEALGAARYGRGPGKQARLAGAPEALDRLRILRVRCTVDEPPPHDGVDRLGANERDMLGRVAGLVARRILGAACSRAGPAPAPRRRRAS